MNYIDPQYNNSKILQKKRPPHLLHDSRSSSTVNFFPNGKVKNSLAFYPLDIRMAQINKTNKHIDNYRLHNKSTIDVIKIDIEWMEFEVLNNLEQTIWDKINTLAIEVHILNDELENQWKILSQKLQSEFPKNNIIQSPYTDKIFLSYSTRT